MGKKVKAHVDLHVPSRKDHDEELVSSVFGAPSGGRTSVKRGNDKDTHSCWGKTIHRVTVRCHWIRKIATIKTE